jgi:hypothetical protein
MTHLDICSKVMAKRKVGSQIGILTPHHGKSEIDPIPLCRWGATRRWKALDEGYNFGLNLVLIGGLHEKL